jgi:hypothetical protein
MPDSSTPNEHASRRPLDNQSRRPDPWLSAIFELEDMYTTIPGWSPRELVALPSGEQLASVTWNGWECPHFEKSAADLIVSQHNRQMQVRARKVGRVYPDDLLARYDSETDSYRFFLINGYDREAGRYSGEWESYSGAKVEVEPGYHLQLYPIGAWAWLWERVDDTGS